MTTQESRLPATADYGGIWSLHLQPEGALLVEKRSLYYLRLTGLATELLLHFSRTQTFDSVVQVKSTLENTPEATVRANLESLLAAHPITTEWLEGAVATGLQVSGSTETYVPLAVALQLTNGCNYSCPFCYAASGQKREGELSAEEWIQALRQFAVHGTLSATLTGGEPTLAPGFRDVLAAASGLMTTVAVFTNGHAWSTRMLDFVAALGNVDIQISIDGVGDTHNRIRGHPQAFTNCMRTIAAFAQRNVSVDVAMTATPTNYEQVYDVATSVSEAGARLLRVGQVQSLGRAEQPDADSFELDDAARSAVDDQLVSFDGEGHAMEVLPWSGCETTEELVLQTGFTPEFLVPGYLSWYVLSDGRVTPCQLEEHSILGDVRLDSVDAIGRKENLARAAEGVHGCHCLPKVQTPEETDLPYAI